jgi:membrane protein YqaA with SNARE-associated domain
VLLRPMVITFVLALAAIGMLGEVFGGRVVWGLAYTFVIACAARDYWRLRSGPSTPQAVADRLVAYILVLAVGVAAPGLDTIETWIAGGATLGRSG